MNQAEYIAFYRRELARRPDDPAAQRRLQDALNGNIPGTVRIASTPRLTKKYMPVGFSIALRAIALVCAGLAVIFIANVIINGASVAAAIIFTVIATMTYWFSTV